MAVFEKGVQSTAEAVIVEFIGREVPEEIGAGSLSPAGSWTKAVGWQSRAASSKLSTWPWENSS